MFKHVILVLSVLIGFTHAVCAGEVYRYKLGDYEVIALNDRVMTHNEANVKLDDAAKLSGLKKTQGWNEGGLNYFVVDTGKQKILFDAGLPGGNTVKMLAQANIKAEEVNIIFITHMHGDHIGGLLDENGKPVFTKAKIYISQEEAAYWSDTSRSGAGFDTARSVLAVYKSNLTLFSQNRKIEGIESIPTFGHTPGHTSYRIASKGQSLYIWGDLMHVKAQFVNPDVYMTYDVDPMQVVKTRKQVLNQLAESGEAFSGMHIAPPVTGKIKKSGDGYEFVPGF